MLLFIILLTSGFKIIFIKPDRRTQGTIVADEHRCKCNPVLLKHKMDLSFSI